MVASLCLFGLLFNYALVFSTSASKVEKEIPFVKEYFEVSGFQHNEDIDKNNTELEDNEKMATEITEFGSITPFEEKNIPEILHSEHIHNISRNSSDIIENVFNMTKTSFEDISEKITATKDISIKETSKEILKDESDNGIFSNGKLKELTDLNMTDTDLIEDENFEERISNEDFQEIINLNKSELDEDIVNNESYDDVVSNEDSKEITDLNMGDSDKDVVKYEIVDVPFFDEELKEIIAFNRKSVSYEYENKQLSNIDKDEEVILTLLEETLMDEVEEFDEVKRHSRASYIPSSLTYAHPNYMIGNMASIEQNSPFRRGMPVKQKVPVKGRVKIARTFTNCQWNMRPTFTSNANKGIYDDNFAMESAPLHGIVPQADVLTDGSKRVAALDRNIHRVDKAVLGKVQASGKFTVAATFC